MAPSQEQVTEEHGSPISDATVYAMKIGLGVKATAIPQMETNAEGAYRMAAFTLRIFQSRPCCRCSRCCVHEDLSADCILDRIEVYLAGSQIETSIDVQQIAQSETYRSSGWQLRHRK